VNSILAAHRRRLLLNPAVFDYYPANGDVLVPRVGSGVTLTCTRANATATRTNASGQIVTVAANTPRIDYDPATGRCLGLLVEESRVNYFLNSDTPATHDSASLSTGAYTLWMQGTGSVAVAAKTATVTGAGTATDGSPVYFSVTGAGTVTFTVTGSPTRAQAEKGAFKTSYIPTAGSAVTRNADVIGGAITSFVSTSAGTVLVSAYRSRFGDQYPVPVQLDDGTNNNRHFMYHNDATTDDLRGSVRVSAATTADMGNASGTLLTAGAVFAAAHAYSTNDFAFCRNGGTVYADTSGAVPTGLTTLRVGSQLGTANFWNGHIRRIRYYDTRIPNDQLQLMTTAW